MFESIYEVLIFIFICLFSLCFGSFLNVVIYRLPNKMNLSKPSSHCPNCGYKLRWYDNIPILSYILLKGKCRYCGSKIGLFSLIFWVDFLAIGAEAINASKLTVAAEAFSAWK